jgi:stage V sporulation protein AF
MRMIILFLTALFGIVGFAVGIVIVFVMIASNKTINGKRSYLYPLIPFNGKALARLFLRLKKND